MGDEELALKGFFGAGLASGDAFYSCFMHSLIPKLLYHATKSVIWVLKRSFKLCPKFK